MNWLRKRETSFVSSPILSSHSEKRTAAIVRPNWTPSRRILLSALSMQSSKSY